MNTKIAAARPIRNFLKNAKLKNKRFLYIGQPPGQNGAKLRVVSIMRVFAKNAGKNAIIKLDATAITAGRPLWLPCD
tara:strand:- start:3269 stop:3499 length:231 start_codon:yes stop_codon:yes gene_type:complete